MIRSIKCNKASFKTIKFRSGFNVILAERTRESTKRDSRNGLGKSTLIEIIHFCLGAKKGETLSKSEMDDWEFILELDLDNKRYSVTRNTSSTNKIIIEGDCSKWGIKPSIDEKTKVQIFSTREWNRCLGTLLFGLQPVYANYKYIPTFRSLISYFIRRDGQSGAFLNPFQQYKNQLEWDKQINNSFLLGLGWEFASKWQILKDRVKVLDQIKQEAKSGLLTNLLGSTGELEALKIRLQSQVNQDKNQLDNFKVHPQYNKIENDANSMTKLIHEYVNSNIDDKRLLEHYEASLKEEIDAKPESVTKVYKEAGLILPDSITKKMNDVISFHKKVVTNRKEFLTSEMKRIKGEILKREQDVSTITDKRVELMQTLKKHGALKEYTQLQTNHQDIVSQLKDTTIKLENLKKFEQGKSAITVEQELLQQGAKNDLNERITQKETAILTFNENSKYLYKAPGILSINVAKTGFKFKVEIERSGSQGIGNMKIFCYDLMLAKIWAKRSKAPGLFIHDSIIFDGVDERQIALALQLASLESQKDNFQYICTINSDNVPREDFDKDFDFDRYVVRKLTDVKESESLLGVRF